MDYVEDLNVVLYPDGAGKTGDASTSDRVMLWTVLSLYSVTLTCPREQLADTATGAPVVL